MSGPVEADVVIVGAGPVGLFAAFELGLFGIKCHLVEALERPGGQCSAFYGDKPIFDVPGHPSILAQELIDRLVDQARPSTPTFSYDHSVISVIKGREDGFEVRTDRGTSFSCRAVVWATGGGVVACPEAASGLPADADGRLILSHTSDFQSSVAGIFAVGDACSYPGKLRLLLSGFHEAALAVQGIRALLRGPATGKSPAKRGRKPRLA